MKNVFAGTVFAFALCATGCTTIPDRFRTSESIYPNCGYRTELVGNAGVALEVFFKKYSFFPNPDDAIQEARECFVRTALELAQRQAKKIMPITAADMSTSATRNIVDAYYSVYVTGKVNYVME